MSSETGMGAIAMGVLFAVLMAISAAYARLTVEYYTVTVDDKERIVDGGGDSVSSKYLLFTSDKTYRVSDSLWHFTFNASDRYNKFKRGETYCVKTYGWRFGFLSMYENIVSSRQGPCAP